MTHPTVSMWYNIIIWLVGLAYIGGLLIGGHRSTKKSQRHEFYQEKISEREQELREIEQREAQKREQEMKIAKSKSKGSMPQKTKQHDDALFEENKEPDVDVVLHTDRDDNEHNLDSSSLIRRDDQI